jgi:hypothetical protein
MLLTCPFAVISIQFSPETKSWRSAKADSQEQETRKLEALDATTPGVPRITQSRDDDGCIVPRTYRPPGFSRARPTPPHHRFRGDLRFLRATRPLKNMYTPVPHVLPDVLPPSSLSTALHLELVPSSSSICSKPVTSLISPLFPVLLPFRLPFLCPPLRSPKCIRSTFRTSCPFDVYPRVPSALFILCARSYMCLGTYLMPDTAVQCASLDTSVTSKGLRKQDAAPQSPRILIQ